MPHPTAFVMHPDCARHDTGWGHPEHQGRLPAIAGAVYRDTPELLDYVLQREGEPAVVDDLLRVHSPEHVERVRQASARAERLDDRVYLDADTAVSGASWEAALAAVGCALTATRLVLEGDAGSAFAAARPPGHHATADAAMGFCLFNNVAIAARSALLHPEIRRVLIIDWDVHHGNGTQEIFLDDPAVYFVSLHQSPAYPGTGDARERGTGHGYGTTRNVPLPAGTDVETYQRAFDEALADVWADHRPDIVFISAGFDCLAGDPLGGFELQPATLHRMAARVREAASETANGRVVAVLEGGYAPERMGAGVVDVLRGLAGRPARDAPG